MSNEKLVSSILNFFSCINEQKKKEEDCLTDRSNLFH